MLGFYLALIDEPNDKEKFVEIYNNYKDLMFCKAMSVLHNTALAEEAVQESFLKIAKNISKISIPVCSKTASFIVIIVRNTSLDIIKKEHINENEQLSYDTPDISMDVLNSLVSENGYEHLVNIVNELDNIYSDVLMLKIVYGYDTDSIVQLLNIPKRTIESRIYRGKKLLQRRLEEEYGTQNVNE